ncbi:MAG TPA: sigma-70 family RNA polymerase sigma factor, partial [Candidatus Limnocylindrales bacterium]|nr:sigma-70 family RNA polymerase sigma factor [Candidatus Limnocylindrales bacterium]
MDDLAARLAADPDAAFEELVRRHERLVYGLAWRILGDAQRAEEAAQDAFLRAHRALMRYPPERIAELRVAGWLARIALNVARNVRRDTPALGAPLEAAGDVRAGPASDPLAAAERRDEVHRWRRLLDGLPAPQRLPVELRHVHGLSYPEIAAALDRPLGTVKVQVHRGVARLRRDYLAESSRDAALAPAIAPQAQPRPEPRADAQPRPEPRADAQPRTESRADAQ